MKWLSLKNGWRASLRLQKEAKTNFSCVIGSAEQEDVEPGFCTVGLMADEKKMRVKTYDVAGKPAKRPFHLACLRDWALERQA